MEALTVAADIALGDNAGDVQRMLDEMEQDCPHNDAWFDRVICPEPCGMMHTYCADCGANLDTCTFDSNPPDGIPL
jgi:hypothetical protein